MLTIKNVTAKIAVFFVLLILAIALSGCMPKGPRALLKGKDLMEQGRFPEALEELKVATSIMPTNAMAWNFLGLAYHQTGAITNAEQAYARAFTLDRNLVEAHFNLGCLRLAENQLEAAKGEFITYTSLRGNNPDGWLKLATAELRLRELSAAEKSFGEALRLNRENPEALNGLGMVQLQRRNARGALESFNNALKVQPDYAPALLNLAIIDQDYLNNRPAALQKYREYLALPNRPENWNAVNATAQALDRELNPPPKPAVVTPASTPAQNTSPTIAKPTSSVAAPPAAAANKPAPAYSSKSSPTIPSSNPSAEVVKLPTEPVIKSAQDVNGSSQTAASKSEPAKSEKHSFLNHLNPLNLFRRSTNAPAGAASSGSPGKPASTLDSIDDSATASARYKFQNPVMPSPGDRSAAGPEFNNGFQAQQADRLAEAIQDYQQAIKLDPAYFEAYYNLGVASTAAGHLSQALTAYETALTLRPESLDARYNFAFVLKQANFVTDAVYEFEELLVRYPKEARAHLILGNIYAQQLKRTDKAKEHYQAVLDIDPHNPQAPAIRYWLTSH